MKIWNIVREELKFHIKIILEGLENCDYTCSLFIEVCGVLYHNSNLKIYLNLVQILSKELKKIKLFIPLECAPEVAKLRK